MNKRNFKISMEAYDKSATIEFDYPDVTSNDVMEGIVGCMRALTWSDDQIIKMCKDYIEEYGNYKVLEDYGEVPEHNDRIS